MAQCRIFVLVHGNTNPKKQMPNETTTKRANGVFPLLIATLATFWIKLTLLKKARVVLPTFRMFGHRFLQSLNDSK